MNVLLVDIGNSRIKWRFANVEPGVGVPSRFGDDGSPDTALPLSEVDQLIDRWQPDAQHRPVEAVFVSNVASLACAGAVDDAVSRTWGHGFVHHVTSKPAQCGVVNGYRDPSQLGVDRWMAMIGAHRLLPDRSVLVCSFGTATTVDLLLRQEDDSEGQVTFVGGLILPGFDAMRSALARDTARLPVAAGNVVDFADHTDDAIMSGIMAAQTGAIHRAAARALARTTNDEEAPICVLAGGGARRVAPFLGDLSLQQTVVPDLVLRGLGCVARDAIVGSKEFTAPCG